jgi:hypothetical protein
MTRPLRTRRQFIGHLARFVGFAVLMLIVSLGIGMVGYHITAGLSWIDSFLNASMILTGMGPVNPMPDDAAKLFSSAYAIFGGAVYPAMTAIVLYPFVHRMMHVLHVESAENDQENRDGR